MGWDGDGTADAEYTAYVTGRLAWLHKVAVLLCQDPARAEDLVQTAAIRLYVHWARARKADNLDGYVRTLLVRVFLAEQGTAWWRRVVTVRQPPDAAGRAADPDAALDLRAALAALGPRQRAVVVLRFYCDLSVEQTARELGCTPGTVKSQSSRALAALRARLTAADDRDLSRERLA
ncbi:SigE family RNA polymerase sigma factor [Actinomadura parmotrematis]|uniref:SigE family RNA polymerase sigma factor n=1 Tax=Actinomadura parmotrematis TaxID=2864039 RepID=A0ABS7FPQ5_9ACTN|nr:SigE family RNA polymerase sigma factor [Actinomadura parmotrematis]MBW8481749.1 SigE family RNA polymerase sigma factor [Actinomadura parmotrematis]